MSDGPSIEQLCDRYDISRQAHYQMRQRRAQRESEEKVITQQVQQIRQRHPRLGVRKLWKMLPDSLEEAEITIGRDRLFDLLRRQGLLVPPLRNQARTTWAGSWRCENLLVDAEIDAPNQAYVSDITYIQVGNHFWYLVLITDVFSRRLMGFDFSDSLALDGLIRALDMALKTVGASVDGLILHSDHGIQYTCPTFRRRLQKLGIQSSMGEVGNCYDNALAERMNGILKIEYGLGGLFSSHQQALHAVQQAVFLYNFERPHLALDYQCPDQVYRQYLFSSN